MAAARHRRLGQPRRVAPCDALRLRGGASPDGAHDDRRREADARRGGIGRGKNNPHAMAEPGPAILVPRAPWSEMRGPGPRMTGWGSCYVVRMDACARLLSTS